MLRVNNATRFTEVHQWISNSFNNTYTGTDDDNAAIGAVTEQTENDKYNEQMMIAFNNWYKGKGNFPERDNLQRKGTICKGKRQFAKAKTKVARREMTITTTTKVEATEENNQWFATLADDQATHHHNASTKSHNYNHKGQQGYSPQQQPFGGGKSQGEQFKLQQLQQKEARKVDNHSQTEPIFNILDNYNYDYYNDATSGGLKTKTTTHNTKLKTQHNNHNNKLH
eukprot:2954061-Amphidinium_carterae.1